MKSIKQQYIDLREGNMSQANFMRNIRMSLPQYVTNITSFNDSIRILKNKGILTEADISSGPNAQWLGSIKDIIEDRWQNGEIKTPAEYGSVMTKLSTQPEGIIAQYGETSAEDAANKLLNSVSHLGSEYDPGPGEDDDVYVDNDEWWDNGSLNEGHLIVNGKIVRTYTQNGDKSYNIVYDDGTKDRIAVSHDDWDSINMLHYNVTYKDGTKGSLNEAKDEKTKYTNTSGKSMYDHFKEIDNLNGQEVLIGIDFEMEKNHGLTKPEAAKIVVKNLKKIPNYYTNFKISGVEGFEPDYIGGKSANAEARQMQPLDKNMGNVVDKKMGMKPVKDVEKVKKDSDKGGETNKVEKGVSLMSLIAKSVRGVQKMDATGEKMKKITMKEGMGEYTFNGNLKSGELSKLKTMLPDAKIDTDEEPGQTLKTTVSSAKYNDKSVKHAVQSVLGMLEKSPKDNISKANLGSVKEQLKKMIRKQLKEMADGMEPMSREDGSFNTNEQ
jgi:hypothetical protein